MRRMPIAVTLLLLCTLGLAQTPSRRGWPPWNVMVQESAMIVTGVVESKSWVIHPERMVTTSKPLPDGTEILELPNPRDYVMGSVFRVLVSQVIKGRGKIRTGSYVSVFVPGIFVSEGAPVLVEKDNYLLFLSPLKADNQGFAGTINYEPRVPVEKSAHFNPRLNYVVVSGDSGAVLLTTKNLKVVDEVKDAMRKSRAR